MDLLSAQINNWQIESNLKDVEVQLKEKLSVYKGVVVTEDTVTQSKKDVAEIRKIKTSIDDARKAVKKEWMAPYEAWEEQCKKLQDLCDEPIKEINDQVKIFEDQKKADKRKLVEEIYNNCIGEFADYLPLEAIFNEKWLNASTKQKDIEYDINEKTTRVRSELDSIKALGSEIESELLNVYKNNGNNLSAAIQRNTQYLADKQRVKNQVEAEVKAEVREEVKPNAEAMGELNNIIHAMKTVKFIVAEEDAQRVENMLSFEDIRYRRVEE